MASYADPTILSFDTATDLSGSAWCVVKLDANEQLVLEAAGTAMAIGVLTDDVADGSGTVASCSVQVAGVAKVKCGATITLGTHFTLMGTTGGEATPATTGKYHFGIPLETAADNDIIPVLLAFGQLD